MTEDGHAETREKRRSSAHANVLVRSLRSIFCPDRDTPDKSTKLGTSLHKLFIIHSGWGGPG